MQLKSEPAVRVAATPPSQRVLATPRRWDRRTDQTVRRFYRAPRASRPLSATGRRSYHLRQLHGSGLTYERETDLADDRLGLGFALPFAGDF
jgi:hypothetical protein